MTLRVMPDAPRKKGAGSFLPPLLSVRHRTGIPRQSASYRFTWQLGWPLVIGQPDHAGRSRTQTTDVLRLDHRQVGGIPAADRDTQRLHIPIGGQDSLRERGTEAGRNLSEDSIQALRAPQTTQRQLDRVADATQNRRIQLGSSWQLQTVHDLASTAASRSACRACRSHRTGGPRLAILTLRTRWAWLAIFARRTGWTWQTWLAIFARRTGWTWQTWLAIFARRTRWTWLTIFTRRTGWA